MTWLTSGVWDLPPQPGEPGRLIVADSGQGNLLSVDTNGRVSIADSSNAELPLPGDLVRPFLLRQSNGRVVLEDKGGRDARLPGGVVNAPPRLLSLGGERRTSGSSEGLQLLGKTLPTGLVVNMTWDWAPDQADSLYAMADLNDPASPNSWPMAIVRFQTGTLPEAIYWVPDSVPEARQFYLKTGPYIATLGSSAYFLSADPEVALLKYDSRYRTTRSDLAPLPDGYRQRPSYANDARWKAAGGSGPRQATAYYKVLEESRTITGLYAWQGALYLLAKDPASPGQGTAWWLFKLDPKDGKQVGSKLRLPTKAAHLVVVPGDTWAFFEKAAVRPQPADGGPYLRTETVLFVPGGWLAEPTASPLAEKGDAAGCLEDAASVALKPSGR